MAIQALFRMGRRARFDIDEFDSPNGSYLASRPHDRVVFSPLLSIAGRLSADCFVRNPCGRRCRQTAFETCPHRRRPLHCRGGCRLGDCLVGRQLTCMELAQGLALWLNSTFIDKWFRDVSGSTQVNAGDIKAMPCPSLSDLERIGVYWRADLTQEMIDAICEELK